MNTNLNRIFNLKREYNYSDDIKPKTCFNYSF